MKSDASDSDRSAEIVKGMTELVKEIQQEIFTDIRKGLAEAKEPIVKEIRHVIVHTLSWKTNESIVGRESRE